MRDGLIGTGAAGSATGPLVGQRRPAPTSRPGRRRARRLRPAGPARRRRSARSLARAAGSQTTARSSATRPGRCMPRPDGGERTFGPSERVELVEEPRRLLLLAAHRGHEQPPAGPGDRDVEQPPLLGQLAGRDGRHAGCVPAGEHVDEASSRAASRAGAGPASCPPARPATHTRSHSRPLLACAVRIVHRRQDAPLAAERVAGNLLRRQVVEEVSRRARGQPVGEPRRRVEQLDHGVQVAVGGGARRTAGRLPHPTAGQPAGVPDRPEHVLGTGLAAPARRGPAARTLADPLHRPAHVLGQHGRARAGRAVRRREQSSSGCRPARASRRSSRRSRRS